MKLSTEHRKIKNKDERRKKKTPRDWDLKIISPHTQWGTHSSSMPRQQGGVQVDRWRIFPGDKSTRRQSEKCQQNLHSRTRSRTLTASWTTSARNTIRKQPIEVVYARMDWGKESSTDEKIPQYGRRYVASGMKLPRQWQKRMRHCDKKVDREKCVTTNKIAVPLKVGAAMAAEIAGVCVRTSIFDLIRCKRLTVQNINQRIHRVLNNSLILNAYLTIDSVLVKMSGRVYWRHCTRSLMDKRVCDFLCVGVGFVRRPHLLVGGVHSVTTYPRGSGRATGTAWEWWRIKREGSWMEWRAQSRRVTLTSCMDEMRQTRGQLEPSDVVCNEWVWLQHELTRRLREHSLFKCRVWCALCWSWFLRRHWCRTSCRSVSPRKRNSKFSSWCCSPTLSCHRQLRL